MTKWILFLFTAFSSLTWGAPAPGAKPRNPQRLVEVQWEESVGAAKYVVEVRHFDGKLLKTFSSIKPLLKFKAPVGDYEIRAKVVGVDGREGPFSEWSRIFIPPKPVEFKEKAANGSPLGPIKIPANAKTLTAPVQLQWPEVETAKQYRLKVYDREKKVVRELILSDPKAIVALPPGDYNFSVTTLAGEKFTSDEKFSPQSIEVGAAQLPRPDIEAKGEEGSEQKPPFKWKFSAKVTYKVKLEYLPFMGEEWEQVGEVAILNGMGEWAPSEPLNPGRHRFSIWAEANGWRPSEVATREFTIKPTEPRLSTIDQDLGSILNDSN